MRSSVRSRLAPPYFQSLASTPLHPRPVLCRGLCRNSPFWLSKFAKSARRVESESRAVRFTWRSLGRACAAAKAAHRWRPPGGGRFPPVSYTHLRAHETDSYLVCRLLLEKKK